MDEFLQVLQSTLTEEYKWLHRHPEPSLREEMTTRHIREFLSRHEIPVLDLPLATGVVARIEGKSSAPIIALRADIDALPITEETGLAFASENPGFMHACGHDYHIAALLGAAKILASRKNELCGTVLLVFQPAEEAMNGAARILETGVLDPVRCIFGMHVRADAECDTVYVTAGADHAAVDHFRITVKGVGTHAAHPDLGADPIAAASLFVTAIQSIVSRKIDPTQSAVISVTEFHAGTTWNVIPETAYLEGTVRTFDPAVRAIIRDRMCQAAEGIGLSQGVEIQIDWLPGTPATQNDPALVDQVRLAALSLSLKVGIVSPSMGGEDFAVYQERIPGVIWQIGVGHRNSLHHPGFTPDISGLLSAARMSALLAETALRVAM